MSFTPTPLRRTAPPEEIVGTTNINFALLQSTIKSLEDELRLLKKSQSKKGSAQPGIVDGKDLIKWAVLQG